VPNRWQPAPSIVITYAAAHAALAGIFAFSADARWQSASWTVGLRMLDRQTWGFLFAVVAVLLFLGRYVHHNWSLAGLLLGAVIVLWWAGSFALSAHQNRTASLTGIVLWTLFGAAQTRELLISVRRRVG
jgi:hypothetical protein